MSKKSLRFGGIKDKKRAFEKCKYPININEVNISKIVLHLTKFCMVNHVLNTLSNTRIMMKC